jgi:hypothetical protein
MPHMLPMPAREFSHPVAQLILMKPDNRLLCHLCCQSIFADNHSEHPPILRNA